MEISSGICVVWLAIAGVLSTVMALDPYYMERAKILSREEIKSESSDEETYSGFTASARRCKRIGEKAAKKRVSCVADTDFYDTLVNRVHMSPSLAIDDRELWDIAYKISKCSLSYSKYFEHACKMSTIYLSDRRRCRRLRTRQARTECKGEIQRKYHWHR
ncbi:hypothetical protein ACF0H5_000147 [Mactra antiquata]